MNTISNFLNTPVPLKKAILVTAGAIAGSTISAMIQYQNLANQANAIIADQAQLNEMYHESVHFLLDRADPNTILEFNQKLDFWRVVREMAPAGTTEEQE